MATRWAPGRKDIRVAGSTGKETISEIREILYRAKGMVQHSWCVTQGRGWVLMVGKYEGKRKCLHIR